ncbi:MAG TPA: hypothetical protein VFS43_32565 [Polyangiaceae bacterium]|nr:hypothetical protein [Polyangiaceae bacterium]
MREARAHLQRPAAEVDGARRRRRLVVADGDEVAEAERPELPRAPAAHAPALEQRAGAQEAAGELHRLAAEVDGARRRRRLVVADVVGVAVAERPRAGRAPAVHRAALEPRARVRVRRDDLERLRPELDRSDRVGQLVVADAALVSVAEQAAGARAPAAHRAVVEHRAGVVAARAHLQRLAPELDRPGRGRRLVVADGVGVAVAEQAAGARAPAAHAAVVEQRAGVRAAGADLHGPAAERHGPRRRGRLVVADRVLVAVAEAAEVALPPAAHAAVVEHRAGVRGAGADLHGLAAELDRALGRRRLVVADVSLVAVTELAREVAAPAAHRAVVEQHAGVAAARLELPDRRGRPARAPLPAAPLAPLTPLARRAPLPRRAAQPGRAARARCAPLPGRAPRAAQARPPIGRIAARARRERGGDHDASKNVSGFHRV